MDYAIAMARLLPGAHFHTTRDDAGVESYAALASAFADEKRGAGTANAKLGYRLPSESELSAAYADALAEAAATAAADAQEKAALSAILDRLREGRADQAEVQAALAWAVARVVEMGAR